ncbi:DNA-binding LacI/PurR family transcriptional regulator [Arthrobacter sp. UYEF20]
MPLVTVNRDVPGVPAVIIDDIFGADFCNPPLTTMSSPIEQAGRVAVSMLLAQLNPLSGAGSRSRSVMPTHLTVRGSTGAVPQAL